MQEEIEELFVSVRDLILSRPDGDVAEVKWLLDHLPSAQQQGGRRQQQHQDSMGQLIQVRTAPRAAWPVRQPWHFGVRIPGSTADEHSLLNAALQ